MKEPMESQDIESNDFNIAHKALASVMNCHGGFALQKPATRNELTVHFSIVRIRLSRLTVSRRKSLT
jgi:hypothetical protein